MSVKNVQDFILNSSLLLVVGMVIFCIMLARDHFTLKKVFARTPR